MSIFRRHGIPADKKKRAQIKAARASIHGDIRGPPEDFPTLKDPRRVQRSPEDLWGSHSRREGEHGTNSRASSFFSKSQENQKAAFVGHARRWHRWPPGLFLRFLAGRLAKWETHILLFTAPILRCHFVSSICIVSPKSTTLHVCLPLDHPFPNRKQCAGKGQCDGSAV